MSWQADDYKAAGLAIGILVGVTLLLCGAVAGMFGIVFGGAALLGW